MLGLVARQRPLTRCMNRRPSTKCEASEAFCGRRGCE